MREVSIIPTPVCCGTCQFCFLNREIVGDREWDKLFDEVTKFFTVRDMTECSNVVRIFGGELFMDGLLKKDFKDNIIKLVVLVKRFIGNKGCVDMPISLENVSIKGIRFAQKLRDEYGVNLQVPFSMMRIDTPERKRRYFRNLPKVGKISRIAILTTGNNDHEQYMPELKKYGEIAWEEPVMFDGFSFSYESMKIPEMFLGVRCVANTLRAITSKGVFTCAGFTRRPSWISDEEWNKLANDPEYLDYGYQQVIDWYGCGTCEKQAVCPGMCWKTYYAQRYVYNNRKCLYKSGGGQCANG